MKKFTKSSFGDLLLDAFIYGFLVLLAIICIYPLYQVIVVSISDPAIVMKNNGMMLIPKGIHFDAYKIVLSNHNLLTGFKNTLFYIVVGTSLVLFTTATGAYVLAKKNVMLKKPIMIYLTITMYFGGGLIPGYLLINNLHLMNTPWAILLPGAFSVWDIIIMRTQFANIPDALKEAAVIDGASDFTILTRILLPLSGAVIAVLVLFSAVGHWNEWFSPMLYLTERSKYPIQSVLREILIDNSSQMMAGAGKIQTRFDAKNNAAAKTLVKYANIVVCTIPILVVYPFLQKYFVNGVIVGSLKG